jgi:hypothetical protein
VAGIPCRTYLPRVVPFKHDAKKRSTESRVSNGLRYRKVFPRHDVNDAQVRRLKRTPRSHSKASRPGRYMRSHPGAQHSYAKKLSLGLILPPPNPDPYPLIPSVRSTRPSSTRHRSDNLQRFSALLHKRPPTFPLGHKNRISNMDIGLATPPASALSTCSRVLS